MPITTPEQISQAFVDAYNSGDIEQLVALYEKDAVLAPKPGKRALGPAAIREALLDLLSLKGHVQCELRYCMQSGDLALLQGEWRLSGTGPDGEPVEIGSKTAEVVRRQPDGTWRYVLDHAWQND